MAYFDFPSSWSNVNSGVTSAALPAAYQASTAYPQSMASLYNSASQAFGSYGQGLAGQSQAQASNYGSYANALSNLAQNYTNQASARYGANAMAEAARQGAVGNIGSSALGSFGQLGGQAMQAWAANQQAYNKALSDTASANQYATSQLGSSRNSALGNLGGAYAQAAAGLSPATLASDIALQFSDGGGGGGYGGGGLNLSGPDGSIGSGSYGGGGYGGGGGMNFSGTKTVRPGNIDGIVNQTYGGLNNILGSLNDDRYGGTLSGNYDRAMGQLDAQHYSSRNMPSQMMNQGLQGLLQLGDQAYGNSGRGMDQFYRAQETAGGGESYSALARLLASNIGSGYRDSSKRVSDNTAALTGGWKDNRAQFDSSLVNVGNMMPDQESNNPLQGQLNDLRSRMANNVMYGKPGELSYLERQERERLQRGIDYLSGLTSGGGRRQVERPKYQS